ncbi:hypothetical protein ACFQ2B_38400 [Streptomyces stramineus]
MIVLNVEGDTVHLHDPHGHPYATLPVTAFTAAWRAESVAYSDAPYVLRSGFVREHEVTPAEALRSSLPGAVRWLAGRQDLPMPPGSLGGAAALDAFADQVSRGSTRASARCWRNSASASASAASSTRPRAWTRWD